MGNESDKNGNKTEVAQTEDKPTAPAPESSGETNPTPPKEIESADTSAGLPPEAPQSTQPPSKPTAPHWLRALRYFAKVLAGVFATGSTLLFLLALWDSYRPKITVSPGGTMNAKSPFGTCFIMQNQGALPIANIRYRTQLKFIPFPGTTNTWSTIEQNVSIIPQMKPLESYSLLIRYTQVQINTHLLDVTNQAVGIKHIMATNELPVQALILSFSVSYEPQFFGKRTDTLFFVGQPDIDGDWQWFPTGHQSVTEQIIDTNLLPQNVSAPAPAAIQTNGGFQAHTNQAKPN